MLRKTVLLASMSMISAMNVYAASPQHTVVAPACLSKNAHSTYQTLATHNNLVLLQTDEAGIQHLIAAKQTASSPCGGFIDVTSKWNQFNTTLTIEKRANAFLSEYSKPFVQKNLVSKKSSYTIKHEAEVNKLLKEFNPQLIWDDLTTLSSFPDRYANSDNGVKAADWFIEQIEKAAGDRKDVSISTVKTGRYYKQPSVVVKLGTSSEPGIVIGGHMDTTSGHKPGADDDGSGSIAVLETAKTILASGMKFKKPIYFIWYAAEEEGLVGSEYVVEAFKKNNTPVSEVIQFDMTGYAYKNDPTIWLITDYVNDDLTHYLKKLITTYVKQEVRETRCGYACSDHASWTLEGFTASMPAEAAFENTNPVLHTSRDTIEKLSLTHMTDYAKLGIAFAVELAEPIA